jgi:hypothetical protein
MSKRERDRPDDLHEPPSPEEAHQQAERERQAAERAEWQRRANDPESAGPGLGRAQDIDRPAPPPRGGPLPAVPGVRVAPTADAGPLPRVVKDFERAPAGTQRFKLRAMPMAGQVYPTAYVLAPDGDEDAARRHYLAVQGIDKLVERQEKAGVAPDKIERPVVDVRALPD